MPVYALAALGLTVPQLPGWKRDDTAALTDLNQGGTALRLVRESAPAGSPRIQVEVAPRGDGALELEAYVQQSLRDMGQLESTGSLRITHVEQQPTRVGPRKAYRIRHEYLLGKGTDAIAVTQVTTLMILDGRGISITAVGRTELFHPLSAAVDEVISGISTTASPVPSEPVQVLKPVPLRSLSNGGQGAESNATAPIDLGKLGGQ